MPNYRVLNKIKSWIIFFAIIMLVIQTQIIITSKARCKELEEKLFASKFKLELAKNDIERAKSQTDALKAVIISHGDRIAQLEWAIRGYVLKDISSENVGGPDE